MSGRNYRDLVVWQKAMQLCEWVYRSTRRFPADEAFGLRSQMRRAAVSIPSNIAEGQGRGSNKDWTRFIRISYGSLRELETQLLIAERLEFLDSQSVNELMELAGEVGRLLNGLRKSLGSS